MKTKTLVFTAALTAALAVVPVYAYAQCTPSTENLGPVRAAVSGELTRLAPYKDGVDSRDLAWAKDHIVEMVPEWLPTTKRIATQAKTDLNEVADECYQGGNADLPAFISCVKKGVLTEVLPGTVTELPAACNELSTAMADPDIQTKARSWAGHWVDQYIEYRQNRPSQ
jgi:hypothetical protein